MSLPSPISLPGGSSPPPSSFAPVCLQNAFQNSPATAAKTKLVPTMCLLEFKRYGADLGHLPESLARRKALPKNMEGEASSRNMSASLPTPLALRLPGRMLSGACSLFSSMKQRRQSTKTCDRRRANHRQLTGVLRLRSSMRSMQSCYLKADAESGSKFSLLDCSCARMASQLPSTDVSVSSVSTTQSLCCPAQNLHRTNVIQGVRIRS